METIESILTSIKKLLGIDESYTHFDPDLIMHETWSDFIGKDANRFSLAKSYMHLKVKLLFDPPLSSAAIDSINRQIGEFEWRLSVAASPGDDNSGEEDTQNG